MEDCKPIKDKKNYISPDILNQKLSLIVKEIDLLKNLVSTLERKLVASDNALAATITNIDKHIRKPWYKR